MVLGILEIPIRSVKGSTVSITNVIRNLGKSLTGLSKEQLELVISSNKLNVAQAALLLQGAGIERQERKQILQKAGLISATAGQTVATEGLTLSLSQLTKILLAQAKAWLTSPLGMTTVAAAGIFALVKVVEYFNGAADRAREQLVALREEYENNEKELINLDGELKRIAERIKELEGKKLSVTEAEELQNLQAQNRELTREKEILESISALKKEEMAYAFADTMNANLNRHDFSEHAMSGWDLVNNSDNAGAGTALITEKEYLEQQFAQYQKNLDRMYELDRKYKYDKNDKSYQTQRKQIEDNNKEILSYLADKQKEFSEDASGVSYFKSPDTADKRAVNEWLDFYNDFSDKVAILTGSDEAKTNAFNRLVDGAFSETTKDLRELGKQGKVTAENLKDPAYDEFVQKLISLGVITDTTDDSLGFIALAFNSFAESVHAASGGAKTFKDAITGSTAEIDSVQSKISTLSDAFTKLHDGTLTAGEVVDLIQEFPELAEYVDMTAEGFGNLDEGLRNVIKHAPDDLIDTLKEFRETEEMTNDQADALDRFIDYLSDMPTDAIRDIKDEFGLVADSIDDARQSLSELEQKLTEPDHDAGYESRTKYIEQLKEILESGEIGSKAYAAITDYMGWGGMTAEQVLSELDRIDDWFTDGSEGIGKFLAHVQELSGPGGALEGLISYDGSEFSYDVTKLEEAANALGIHKDVLVDLIQKVRMYSSDWGQSVDSIFNELSFKGLIKEGEDGKLIASLEEIALYLGKTETEARDLISTINQLNYPENQINILEDTQSQNEITLIVNGEEVTYAIEDVGELRELLATMPGATIDIVDETGEVREGLTITDQLLDAIIKKKYQKVVIEYETKGSYTPTAGNSGGKPGLPAQKAFGANASGTDKAKAGPALLGDEYSPDGSPKPELVVTDGEAYIAGANGPEIAHLKNGDQVYTADQTRKILRGSRKGVKAKMPAYRKGVANTGPGMAYLDEDGNTVIEKVEKVEVKGSVTIPPAAPEAPSGKPGSKPDASSETNPFEEAYKEHQHLVAMDKETMQEYLDWLDGAYKDAYEKGLIDLDDYRKYEEEVYEGRKDLFRDYLNDTEHQISILEREEGNEDKIISMYQEMMDAINAEIEAAKARGLDENSDYIQELQNQYHDYADEIISIEEEMVEKREEVTEDAKKAVEDLVEFRIKMIEQEIKAEKDALNDKLDDLKDYYDKQKKMLQDQYDEEDYLEEQHDKRKAKSDIEAELASLERDDSAWAQKRKLELQEELASAQKELDDFEKDHARQETEDLLDEMYEKQAAEIESQIEALEQKLNDPNAIYNQALSDIQNNTADLYQEMVEYNNKYGLIIRPTCKVIC